jgi:hypothetical protein
LPVLAKWGNWLLSLFYFLTEQGLGELVSGISALRVAGLRGLIAVRIGHPMVQAGTSMI